MLKDCSIYDIWHIRLCTRSCVMLSPSIHASAVSFLRLAFFISMVSLPLHLTNFTLYWIPNATFRRGVANVGSEMLSSIGFPRFSLKRLLVSRTDDRTWNIQKKNVWSINLSSDKHVGITRYEILAWTMVLPIFAPRKNARIAYYTSWMAR